MVMKKSVVRSLWIGLCLIGFFEATMAQTYAIRIAKLKYDGGGDWYGNETSLPLLLRFVREQTLLDVAPKEDIVDLDSDKIFLYPYVYATGHGNISFSARQVERLRRYLENGGFFHADDNYGMMQHIKREMKKVFPDQDWVELPHTHPIFKTQYTFGAGLPKVHEHDGKPPQAFGLFHDGRLVFLFTYESDLGDGWEAPEVHNDPPEKRLAALQMGANILAYILTH